MVIIPALHILDNKDMPEQKGWGWYRVSEFIEAVNYYLSINGVQSVDPANLYTRYGYLNSFKDSFGVGKSALPTRKGQFGEQFHEFITDNINLARVEFIPACWGDEILRKAKRRSIVCGYFKNLAKTLQAYYQ